MPVATYSPTRSRRACAGAEQESPCTWETVLAARLPAYKAKAREANLAGSQTNNAGSDLLSHMQPPSMRGGPAREPMHMGNCARRSAAGVQSESPRSEPRGLSDE